MDFRGQGTIEYLVILAVVVIVALIVVSLMINSTAPSQGIVESTSKIATQSNPIAIIELTANPDGNIFLKLQNNTGERITINTIIVGNDSNTFGTNLPISTDGSFKLPTTQSCTEGQATFQDIVITYTTSSGLQKRQTYPTGVTIPCEDTTITSTQLSTPETPAPIAPPVTLSTYITDFNGGLVDHAIFGSVKPSGELDWNTNDTGQELTTSHPLATNAVGLWKLDGNSDDSTTNNNDGTNTNFDGDETTTGKFGQAYELDGSDDYINLGNNTSLQNMSGMTVSVWVKPNTAGLTSGGIINKHRAGTNNRTWTLRPISSNVRLEAWNCSAVKIYVNGNWEANGTSYVGGLAARSTTIMYAGQWYHIVGVASGCSTLGTSSVNAGIGYLELNGGTPSNFWDGTLDEVMILNSALSDSEISELYSLQKGQWVDGNLIAYYNFNGDANDSARGHNGVAGGNTSFSDSGLWDSNATTLDTTAGTKIIIPYNDAWNLTNDSTISFWTYPSNETLNDMVISKNTTSNSTGGWYIKFSNSGSFWFGGASGTEWQTGHTYESNKWQQFTIVRQGNTLYTYKNGTNQTSTTITNGYPQSPGSPGLVIGGFEVTDCCNFDGKIEDVKIWKKALSSTEVLADYQTGLGTYNSEVQDMSTDSDFTSMQLNTNGPFYGEELDLNENLATGLVGLWHLNGDVLDSSGNDNNGVITGVPSEKSCLWDTNCLSFTTSDYFKVNDSPELRVGQNFTMSAWVKRLSDPSSSWQTVISKNHSSGWGYALNLSYGGNTGNPAVSIYTTAGIHVDSGVPLPLNEWHHIVGTYDGANIKVYIDGELVKTQAKTGSIREDTTPFCVNIYCSGGFTGGHKANADLEDLAVWNRTLSASEIKQLFNKGAARIGTQYRSCNDTACSGESWSTTAYPTNGTINLTGTGTYFQFKNTFELFDFGTNEYKHQAYATLEDVNIVYQN